jgi:peptidoglycan hydrolase CwlO-like protein
MAEIDVSQDLGVVTGQIEDLIKQLQDLDGQRQQLAQQIQNLNGVAMYLRGKESPEAVEVSEGTDKES